MYTTSCERVEDGGTFLTSNNTRVRLANVCAPEFHEPGGAQAKTTLENLILRKYVDYQPVGQDGTRIIAEVWIGTVNVNQYMRNQGYTC